MPAKIFTRILTTFLALLVIGALTMPAAAQPTNFTITTQVTAGEGWIDTVEPVTSIPLGAAKHYRIRPARGWMISDVQIDGRSIGPSVYATIPFVQANHTIRASFEPFDPIKATNVSTKVSGPLRVLLLGESIAVQRIAQYLGAIDGEGLLGIGFQGILEGNDLLVEYYRNRTGPTSSNTMLNKITEGWDYVIPIDLYDYQSLLPELHLEGLRLLANRAWFQGGQARLVLPTLWTDNNSDKDQEKIAANVYRIASGMRVPVVPVGQAWAAAVDNLGLPDSRVEQMSSYAAFVFATMLYVQFYEQKPTVPPWDIESSVVNAVNDLVWDIWQAEKTQSHFSGAYNGVATPFGSNGGQGYHFGTSTRWGSVDKMKSLIADRDPEMGGLAVDGADGMDEATVPGNVQDNLNSKNYTYMWRQWKGEDSFAVLNQTIRSQFGEDPYFIWYERYMDRTADVNASRVGYAAFLEVSNTLNDNLNTVNNPNRKGRSPQSHIGWGRIWEERTDIQMMENLSETPAHAHDVLMSMFAAQTYALITGRDASRYGSWQYDPNSQPDLAEKARYAQRVGFETIMQAGTLDINEPYDQSPSAVPIFNPNSIFYTPSRTFYAQDDFYVAWTGETLNVSAPGILANDPNNGGAPLTINWQPRQATSGEVILQEDGSFSYTPAGLDKGAIWLRYTLTDGSSESNPAIVWIRIMKSNCP